MTAPLLLKKLRIDEKEFVKNDELKRYCKAMGVNYTAAVKYLTSHGHLIRIFRGIFYVKSIEEEELGKSRYTLLEIVAKGLELKGVKNWYFGLNTALKLNNMTHEYFSIDYVVNDNIFRARPINIAGYKFKFVKLVPKLFGFGVKTDGARYSDPEKTILDMVYLDRYGGVPPEKTALNVSEYMDSVDFEKLTVYAAYYPITVARFMEEMLSER